MIFCYTHRLVSNLISYQRAFFRQLMRADAEKIIQTLNGTQESCRREEERTVGARGVKDTKKPYRLHNQLRESHRGSQRLNSQPWDLSLSALGLLHTCCGCLAWGFYWTPNRGCRVIFDPFACGTYSHLLGCLL